MPLGFIRITSRPKGDAPSEIRDKWIGLVLPVEGRSTGPVANLISEGLVDDIKGFRVRTENALLALRQVHPETKEWWQKNARLPHELIFDADCCELAKD